MVSDFILSELHRAVWTFHQFTETRLLLCSHDRNWDGVGGHSLRSIRTICFLVSCNSKLIFRFVFVAKVTYDVRLIRVEFFVVIILVLFRYDFSTLGALIVVSGTSHLVKA